MGFLLHIQNIRNNNKTKFDPTARSQHVGRCINCDCYVASQMFEVRALIGSKPTAHHVTTIPQTAEERAARNRRRATLAIQRRLVSLLSYRDPFLLPFIHQRLIIRPITILNIATVCDTDRPLISNHSVSPCALSPTVALPRASARLTEQTSFTRPANIWTTFNYCVHSHILISSLFHLSANGASTCNMKVSSQQTRRAQHLCYAYALAILAISICWKGAPWAMFEHC